VCAPKSSQEQSWAPSRTFVPCRVRPASTMLRKSGMTRRSTLWSAACWASAATSWMYFCVLGMSRYISRLTPTRRRGREGGAMVEFVRFEWER